MAASTSESDLVRAASTRSQLSAAPTPPAFSPPGRRRRGTAGMVSRSHSEHRVLPVQATLPTAATTSDTGRRVSFLPQQRRMAWPSATLRSLCRIPMRFKAARPPGKLRSSRRTPAFVASVVKRTQPRHIEQHACRPLQVEAAVRQNCITDKAARASPVHPALLGNDERVRVGRVLFRTPWCSSSCHLPPQNAADAILPFSHGFHCGPGAGDRRTCTAPDDRRSGSRARA